MNTPIVTLMPVDPDNGDHLFLLYCHLGERTPQESISHKSMPSFDKHVAFVKRMPYKAWYMIRATTQDGVGEIVGNIYLTTRREVGIHIRGHERGYGHGSQALALLREKHPGPLLANINPANTRSIEFFKKHGARLVQYTYEL